MKLKPYPDYKDSGLPWLGKVPVHWEKKRAKLYFREIDERSQTGEEELLSVSHLTGVTPRSQKNVTMFKAETYVGHKLCQPRDIVVNTMWAWMAALGVAKQAGIVSASYAVYRPRTSDTFIPEYLDHLLRTQPYAAEYVCRSTGIQSSRLRLYPEQFLDIPVLCPLPEEQEHIVAYLRGKDRQIHRFIRNKRRLIELLHEQKQAIINRAVTSGLDPKARLKPSGVEWLGEVPEHWEIRRLKTLAHMRSGESITGLSINDTGDYPIFGGNGMRGYTSTYTHEGDYVLIGRQGALCGNVHYARGRFFASEHAIVASLFPGHDLMWYGELLRVMNLNQYSMAAAQPGLAVERVQNLWVPVPPLAEQSRIAQHIQSETGPVNLTIARTQREIDLIREYRTRLIADVVTGKVDVRNVKCEERRVKEGDEDRWDEIGDTGDNEGPIDAESNIGETDKEVEEV